MSFDLVDETIVTKGMPSLPKGIVDTGNSSPLGATVAPTGVNFSAFARNASGVELVLFDRVDDPTPSRIIQFDPIKNRTYPYWHAFVAKLKPGQLYGYRVRAPFDPANGMRFDPDKILLDPYGRVVVVPMGYNRHAAFGKGDTVPTAMKSVVLDPHTYDW